MLRIVQTVTMPEPDYPWEYLEDGREIALNTAVAAIEEGLDLLDTNDNVVATEINNFPGIILSFRAVEQRFNDHCKEWRLVPGKDQYPYPVPRVTAVAIFRRVGIAEIAGL